MDEYRAALERLFVTGAIVRPARGASGALASPLDKDVAIEEAYLLLLVTAEEESTDG